MENPMVQKLSQQPHNLCKGTLRAQNRSNLFPSASQKYVGVFLPKGHACIPFLVELEADQKPIEVYMVQTLKQVINQFRGVSNLICQMLSKITKILLVYIKGFHTSIDMKVPQRRPLEGRQGLNCNLQNQPPHYQSLWVYSQGYNSWHHTICKN